MIMFKSISLKDDIELIMPCELEEHIFPINALAVEVNIICFLILGRHDHHPFSSLLLDQGVVNVLYIARLQVAIKLKRISCDVH